MIALYHAHPLMMEFDAQVISCQPAAGQEGVFEVILSNTAFYPTGGGQPCDAGTIDGQPVIDVTHEGDDAPIVHFVRCGQPLQATVHGVVDEARRLDHSQQHSGQHLLSNLLHRHFGAYSLGLHIGAKESYVDIAQAKTVPMSREIADQLEAEIAQWIARGERVHCFFPTAEQLRTLPLRKKPDAHEMLRIVHIGTQEAVACCGTHVSTTAQVQAVTILSWQQSHGNLRIFFVAGLRAINYAKLRIDQADAAAKLFSCSIADVMPAIERMRAQNTDLARQLSDAKKQLMLIELAALQPLKGVHPLQGAQSEVYAAVLDGASEAQLKDGIAALTLDEHAACFLAAPSGDGYAVAVGVGAASPLHAGNTLKAVLAALGGKGGGRKDSAFGRCQKMDLAKVKDVLLQMQ